MPRSRALDQIQNLDPLKDHKRIVFLSTRIDFPFDTTRALEFALFRTFCVPSISALLDRTREFGDRDHPPLPPVGAVGPMAAEKLGQ